MVKSILLSILSVSFGFVISDGSEEIQQLKWSTLADVEYYEVFDEELDAWYWLPNFGESVKKMGGEQVYITGYMVPVEPDRNFFVLSRYPTAQCFFCGGAGPESVLDLWFEGGEAPKKFKEDERITWTGKLKLNDNDEDELTYILENAIENK